MPTQALGTTALLSTAKLDPATAYFVTPPAHPPVVVENLEKPYTSKLRHLIPSRRRKPATNSIATPPTTTKPLRIPEKTSAPSTDCEASSVRFLLPDGPNHAGVPRVVVHKVLPPSPGELFKAEQERDWYEETSKRAVRNAERIQWERNCVVQGRTTRRDSLDGLRVVTCPRAKKSCGCRMGEWTREHCSPRMLLAVAGA